MDLQYLSRVLVRLRPLVRDGVVRRTRLERVLGTLQTPAATVRPEVERLLSKAGILVEEDLPAPLPVASVVERSVAPDHTETSEGLFDGLPVEAPRDGGEAVPSPVAKHAIATARRRIAADRRVSNHAKILLNAEQEVGLALLIRGHENRPLEKGDFARLSGEARRAAECLFLHNQGLVRSVAQWFPQTGMAYDDLVQHGALGLIRAIELFDPTQGNKFSTYATWWIRQSISRGVANEARLIRLPVHMVERVRKVWKTRTLLTDNGRPPSLSELALACDLDRHSVLECLRLGPPDLPSLDMKMSDGEATLADVLDINDPEQSPEQQIEHTLLQEQIQSVLSTLSTREAGVVSMRFGFTTGEQMTLDEIGRVYGVTRERIRQIEGKVVKKLKEPPRSTALAPYYFGGGPQTKTATQEGCEVGP